jgi:hypothetical protein
MAVKNFHRIRFGITFDRHAKYARFGDYRDIGVGQLGGGKFGLVDCRNSIFGWTSVQDLICIDFAIAQVESVLALGAGRGCQQDPN